MSSLSDQPTALKVATIGPSQVGKTSLVTAILDDTKKLLSGTSVSLVAADGTAAMVNENRERARLALGHRTFETALGGSQEQRLYKLTLRVGGRSDVAVPFEILDYPGQWLEPDFRVRNPEVTPMWEECLDHVEQSVMLLIPIDAVVLMEAKGQPDWELAAADLLQLSETEELVRMWTKFRAKAPSEPATIVLAPLKCESYFPHGDGERVGTESEVLEKKVLERYGYVLDAVREELEGFADEGSRRAVRVVYAPIETFGCVELMDATWFRDPTTQKLRLRGTYRVRGSGHVQVKSAGIIVQELCASITDAQRQVEREAQSRHEDRLRVLQRRATERKGFWGTLRYHVSGEATQNVGQQRGSEEQIRETASRRQALDDAIGRLASRDRSKRARLWEV